MSFIAQESENRIDPHFGRAARLTLAFVLLLIGASTAQLIYRYFLPTDGWAGESAELNSTSLMYFRNLAGMASALQPLDIVTAIEETPLANFKPGERPPFWDAGNTLDYTILRGDQELSVAVPIGHWTLRSLAVNQIYFISTLFSTLGTVVLLALAFLAFFRRPYEPAARVLLVFATALGAQTISALLPASISAAFDPLAWLASAFFSYSIFGILIGPSLLAFTLVFPKPKPVVVRHRWLAITPFGIGLMVATALYSGGSAYIGWVSTMLMLIASLASLFHSALTMRDAVSRAQLLWAFGGFGMGMALFLLNFPSAFGWVPDNIAPWLAGIAAFGVPVIGVGLGIAVLRYHLFDIDIIIRRTTSYAILTALLALVYFGSIILLQRLLTPLTGESDIAVVLSTLLYRGAFLAAAPPGTRCHRPALLPP